MPEPNAAIETVWLTYREAARHIKVAVGTLRNMVSAGRVPFARNGGIVRFRREALDEWLERGSRNREHNV